VFDETASVAPPPVTPPPGSGLHVSARLEEFDLDRWLALVGGDGAPVPEWLARVGANARRLVYLDRDFGAIDVELARDQNNWVGGVSGTAAEGRLRFDRGAHPRVTLDLAHLRLPPLRHPGGGAETDPRELPALDLHVREFEVRGKALGELAFTARPQPQGWHIEQVRLVRPETRLEASGEWRREYGESSSRFSAHIASDDVGRTLEAFGLADQVEGATAELKAELAWNGAPADVEYASLNGSVELNAAKGRFPQLDQGAAKLFGILDFSAIGRYLALDFTPIFGKGFAFDHLGGRVALERGNAFTDGFSIRGPSARMRFNGRIGLLSEDFNLTLDVYPSLSDSLTLGALAVGGPTAALWTFIAQKLFRKQIEEGTRVTYLVQGPWGKPEVTRKLVEVPARQPQEIN
jgi:uncharacterized protein YhdP